MHRLVLALLIAASPSAWANAGIPMLALAWPAQWLAFVPVVGVECFVIAKALRTSFRAQLWPVAKANFLSTLVGIPLAWLAMLAIEFVIGAGVLGALSSSHELPSWAQVLLFPFMAAWIGGSSVLEFQAAFLVLAVPFCFISIYIEHRSLSRAVAEVDENVLRRAVRIGNVFTYCLLCFAVLVAAVL